MQLFSFRYQLYIDDLPIWAFVGEHSKFALDVSQQLGNQAGVTSAWNIHELRSVLHDVPGQQQVTQASFIGSCPTSTQALKGGIAVI